MSNNNNKYKFKDYNADRPVFPTGGEGGGDSHFKGAIPTLY